MTNMPMRVRNVMGWLVLCVLASVAAWPALAQDTTYQATVPVADTSAAQRSHAFAVALDHVLARVSSRPLDDEQVNTQAATYVQQYQYQRAPAGAPEPFLLIVNFAPSSIHHLVDSLSAANPATTPDNGIAGTPAAVGGGQGSVWVSNLHSALDFAHALAAFHSAPGVSAAAVQQTQDGGMLLDVHTSMPLQQVLATLEGDGHLVASDTLHAGATASLRWVK